ARLVAPPAHARSAPRAPPASLAATFACNQTAGDTRRPKPGPAQAARQAAGKPDRTNRNRPANAKKRRRARLLP
ncbi:hypothetical protein, partial [Achromobacter sp. DMS1]|uniref:hypothetical protein n=1 Tax=Achromobacter sp. DMS1 TaxID=1688405 RepID=UPI001F2D3885